MFTNTFYSDDDCSFILFDGANVSVNRFVRLNWNRGNPHRTPFQRDLDNLVFSGPFRRLQGKTQVRRTGNYCFSRTRLSHSIEVARIAKSIVNHLCQQAEKSDNDFIDADLVEFACFAHDIGNPPFGHSGERQLNILLKECGGFEGNAQSLRIITETAWTTCGISPTKASIDSILKYKRTWSTQEQSADTRAKFLYDYQEHLLERLSFGSTQSIECQIMDLADDIGNALIDFYDGIRSKIITKFAVKRWRENEGQDSDDYAVKNIISAFDDNVMDKFTTVRTGDLVKSIRFISSDRTNPRYGYAIELGGRERQLVSSLKRINRALLFQDPQIRGNDNQGAFTIRVLFDILAKHYIERPDDLLLEHKLVPKDWHDRIKLACADAKPRYIADYIAGMTDDYADMLFNSAIRIAL